MGAVPYFLCLLSIISISISNEINPAEDSWAKLEISPRAVASMPYNNYRINIYEHADVLKSSGSKNKYSYAPISLLDPQSPVSGFNNATKECEMRFRVYLWNELVEKEIVAYLKKALGIEVSLNQVQVIPFEKVILSTTEQPSNYKIDKYWIPYQSDQYLEFRIICNDMETCDYLAEQMRFNPQQFTHLKLQFSLDSQRSKRKETIIRVENILSGSMMAELDQKLPNADEVFLTAADTKRLLSEAVTNVISETFSDDEIVHQSAESTIYNLLEKFLVTGYQQMTAQSASMWDSVFWNNDNYRPDRTSKTISEVYRNSVSEAQQKMKEAFSTSQKNSVEIGVTFKGFGFNTGFTHEKSDSSSKEKEDFLKLMKESRDNVQWEGEKFSPKPMKLSRVNLAKVRNTQNFREIKTQVVYTQSVLSTAVKTPSHSDSRSLDRFSYFELKLTAAIATLKEQLEKKQSENYAGLDSRLNNLAETTRTKDHLNSLNQEFKLAMQTDGHLCVYQGQTPFWCNGKYIVNGLTYDSEKFLSLSNEIITVSNGGGWGYWGPMETCPRGSKAIGFSLQVEGNQGGGVDDTALNTIQLHCSRPGNNSIASISSTKGFWGDWGGRSTCLQNGHLTAFQLRVEPSQGGGDDSAANNINFKCSNGGELYGYGLSWGNWGPWSGECQYGICGIQTLVEPKQGDGDDSALNDVRFLCC